MRIGTSLWGFRETDLESVLSYCAEVGISVIEAQIHAQTPRHFRLDMSDEELNRVVGRAADRGIFFEALALSNDFTAPPERLSGQIDEVLAGLAFAVRLKIRRVRIFAGWRRPEAMDEATFDRLIAALQSVARRAAELGIVLGIENHGGITATTKDVQRILDAADRPALGLLYDPANFVRSHEDPVAALRSLRGRLVYTHAKDLTEDGDGGTVCSVGQGVMPWGTILDVLAKEPGGLVIIEQTNPADVRETTRQSLAAIRARLQTSKEVRP